VPTRHTEPDTQVSRLQAHGNQGVEFATGHNADINTTSRACVKTPNQIPLCEARREANDESFHRRRRARSTLLLPASLEDYVEEDNPVRVVDAFIDELDLGAIGFTGVTPAATGRPSYHPSTLLKLYLYGYLNRVQSSRRLEREARRNVEVMG
jgi:Transposase domain (DUF772)